MPGSIMTKHPKPEFEGYSPLFALSDSRRFQRVQVSLPGRCLFSCGSEHPCRTLDISPGGMRLAALAAPRRGEAVIAEIENLGRFEGTVIRILHDGFAMTLRVPAAERELLAAKLTWHANRRPLDIRDERAQQRIVPINQHAIMRTPDGCEHMIRIVDFSGTGVAVETSAPVRVGLQVLIGETEVTVLRVSEQGFAGLFFSPFAPGEINENTIL
jgi:hypothetical protein